MREIRYTRSVSSYKTTNRVEAALVFIILFVYLVFTSSVTEALNIRNTTDTHKDTVVVVVDLKRSANNSEIESTRTIGEAAIDAAGILQKVGLKASLIDNDDQPHDKTFFGEDSDGNPVVVGSWFQYGSYTLATAMFGTAFLVACAATAVYYVIFVVTDPSQTHFTHRRRRSVDGSNNSSSGNGGGGYITKIFNMFLLANDIYEKLDFSNPDCQQKVVCEIQESKYFENSLSKRLSHTLLNLSYWNSRVTGIESLRRADKTGLNPDTSCTDSYSTCKFSIDAFENKLKSLS